MTEIITELRRCPFCKTKSGIQIHDDKTLRAYECCTCLAVEKITKSEKSGWWYHGWQQPDDDDTPGFRCNGDGITAKAPTPFAHWTRNLQTSA